MIQIASGNLEALEFYASLSEGEGDDLALQELTANILAASGASGEAVGEAIDRFRSANPNWTMDEVFEKAVKELNPECSTEELNQIRSAWQEFTQVADIDSVGLQDILPAPGGGSDLTGIKDTMVELMLLMIELAGEESASQLLEGAKMRDEVMVLAKEKAKKIRDKAVANLICGLAAGVVQIAASSASMASAGKGLAARRKLGKLETSGAAKNPAATETPAAVKKSTVSKEASATPKETPASKDTVTDAPATKDAPDAKETVSYEKKIADLKADIQFHGSMGQAYGGMGQGGAAALNALGGFIAAQMDAEMALIDGETQVANITKETADKLRQKAAELIQACMQLMQNISQADYQTMTTIGRI